MNKVLCALAAVVLTVGCATAQTFTDKRDGKTYRTVKIGKQTWMAENLNYKTDSSWCYDNKDSNCKKYGRLYHWDAAMKACPAGWHLPDTAEWGKLENFVGKDSAGTKLKSKSDWNYYHDAVPGTDDFGFSAMPGGSERGVGFVMPGEMGNWWTATEYDTSRVFCAPIMADREYMDIGGCDKDHRNSVRCLRD
jgi:uncharacterized protein (TIGR02145 family)